MALKTCRDLGYTPDDRWAKLPTGWKWSEAVGVATDSEDRVYVFNRGEHPLMIFDRDGSFLSSWGEGLFVRPHGITTGPDGSVWCTDDTDHTVRKFTPEGRLLLTLGTRGKPSDTGATSMDFRTIVRAGPPFHYPTNLAIAPTGDLYITDGYGNARLHKFSADGRCSLVGRTGQRTWPAQVPHGIAIDQQGIIYVADRENSRVQLFDLNGKYLSEWTDVARPCQVFIDPAQNIYIAELGFRAGMWPGISPPTPDAAGGRVSIFDRQGNLQARWGGGDNPCTPGDFFAPHDLCVDSHGDIYVAEVVMSGGGNRGLVSPECHSLQKFCSRAASGVA